MSKEYPGVPASEPIAYCEVCKVYLHYDADIGHCPEHQAQTCPLRGAHWAALKQKIVQGLLVLFVGFFKVWFSSFFEVYFFDLVIGCLGWFSVLLTLLPVFLVLRVLCHLCGSVQGFV